MAAHVRATRVSRHGSSFDDRSSSTRRFRLQIAVRCPAFASPLPSVVFRVYSCASSCPWVPRTAPPCYRWSGHRSDHCSPATLSSSSTSVHGRVNSPRGMMCHILASASPRLFPGIACAPREIDANSSPRSPVFLKGMREFRDGKDAQSSTQRRRVQQHIRSPSSFPSPYLLRRVVDLSLESRRDGAVFSGGLDDEIG